MKRGRRPNNIPKQQVEAEKLYLEGIKKSNIATSAGVSLMTIYRWAKRYGWEIAYKQRYGEELSKIKDPIKRFLFIRSHRIPKREKKQQNC